MKNEEIFSITDHHCEELERGFFCIAMSDTMGANGQSLKNAVNGMVIIFVLKKIPHSPAMEVKT